MYFPPVSRLLWSFPKNMKNNGGLKMESTNIVPPTAPQRRKPGANQTQRSVSFTHLTCPCAYDGKIRGG